MKKLNDKKISVLAATALTVSLVMPTVQMIPAEENGSVRSIYDY